MDSILAPADLPELFLALSHTEFTFPLAHLVIEYAGTNNAFGIALWRVDPAIEPPFWIAEYFSDWVQNAVDPNFFTNRLLPACTTIGKHGLLSSYCGPKNTPIISTKWRTLFAQFAYMLQRHSYSDFRVDVLQHCVRWTLTDYTRFIRRWDFYNQHVSDELFTTSIGNVFILCLVREYIF